MALLLRGMPLCGIMLVCNDAYRRTLDDIFQRPDRRDIPWADFVNLLRELDANITEKGGSMVGVRLNGRYAVFHRPHPGNTIYVSDLKRIRRFLVETGVVEQQNLR